MYGYIAIGVAGLQVIIGLPMALKLIPFNRHFGYRSQLSLSSEPLWYSMNQTAGVLFVIGGSISLMAIWLLGRMADNGSLAWSEQTRQLISSLIPTGFALLSIAITQLVGERLAG